MKSLNSLYNLYIFIFLFILAFVVRISFLLYFNFDGFYGQDSYAYADFSKQFYTSIINFQIPQQFYWPIGFLFFTSIFAFLTASSVDISALILSLNAGALTAAVMFLLGFELFKNIYESQKAKLISFTAGLILCFSGIAVKSSIVVMSDALGLFFIVLSAYYLVKYINNQKSLYLILCFVSFSFGLMTRYANGLFLGVIIIALVILYAKSGQKKKIIYDFMAAFIIGLIIFLPQLYYIIKYGVPYLQYEGQTPTWVANWSPLNFFRKEFLTFDGMQNYKFWNGIYYISPVLHPLFLSLFGLSFLFGFYKSLKKPRRLLLTICLCWIAIYFIYLAGNPFQSIRYTLSFFPPLILISVFGIGELKVRQRYISLFIALGIILLYAYSYYDINKLTERKNKELESVEWLKKNVPANSHLFTFEITGAVKHYSQFNVMEFHNYRFSQVKNIVNASSAVYFFLPVEKLRTQWKNLPIERNYDSLKSSFDLIPVGNVNGFEGYKIEK